MRVEEILRANEVARAAAKRTSELVARLRQLDSDQFEVPSSLPGWSRLTVLCHLRYGAAALLRMTSDALADRATAYYPEGRATQRPMTLISAEGQLPNDVLDEWDATAARLDKLWLSVEATSWSITVTEPADNPDLGQVSLARLALFAPHRG